MDPTDLLDAYAAAVYAPRTRRSPSPTRRSLCTTCGSSGCTAARPHGAEWSRAGLPVWVTGSRVTFEDVRSTVTPDLALVHAFVTYAGLGPAGEQRRAMNNRLSLTLLPSADRWVMLRQHSSAPASPGPAQVTQ
ncbi:nuclear transport factor 2 family protein [Deinococcus taeanensis]|uniref:nuclear transport factor 2 family protein n=1 Tax=Deinococcus taeanensis TaxID=2737050 RepID=UPI001CDCADCC|nr:nuclear transport factor 2 family protein [Deinococcus taeanensis]UBV42852.1 nuclear transport factor 2 family protein [Deinococcus taeanensis]